MAKKKMTTASCKAKGRRLQAEVAERISKVTCIPVEKDGEIEGRLLRGRAKKLFCFHGIECKNTEAINIWQALAQAETHGGKPIVFFKRNRSETYVAMKADDFFELYALVVKEMEK
jgi:hypothetical protein